MKRLAPLTLALGAALAAPAFADVVTYTVPTDRAVTSYYLWDPVTRTYVERPAVVTSDVITSDRVVPAEPVIAPSYPVATTPSQTVVYDEDIYVTAPRAREDDLITQDVADTIASDPRITGRVGVETYRNNVTLTGRVTSPTQVERAQRDAQSVNGVRDVNNELRSSVGNF
jgi:hypothetical protein